MIFNPDRFLPSDDRLAEPDPHTLSFGFGRRICPGRLLADTVLFVSIAQTLAVFKIGPRAREDDADIKPELDFLPGIISYPAPFKASIRPRSPHHEALIRSIEQQHPWQEGDSRILKDMTY